MTNALSDTQSTICHAGQHNMYRHAGQV